MNRILLIGAYGDGSPTTSGQIIRTCVTYDELKKRYGEKRVLRVNTSLAGTHRLSFLVKLAAGLLRSKTIMVIVSSNGMRVLYPILEKASKLFGRKVLNSIVGGTVKSILERQPECRGAMKSFAVNWVQLPTMIDELAAEGIYNSEVLPNSKPMAPVKAEDIRMISEPPYRFCTFSRISREKGVDAAIEAVKAVRGRGVKAELDIYGQPDDGFREEFEEIMASAPDYIRYCGVAPYDKTAELLKDYYMLLFPTTFVGEGFPGTIVDALFAGLPVIATDWKHNAELIADGETGYVYDYHDKNALAELIERAVSDPEGVYRMSVNCAKEAEKYSIDRVMDIICARIGD